MCVIIPDQVEIMKQILFADFAETPRWGTPFPLRKIKTETDISSRCFNLTNWSFSICYPLNLHAGVSKGGRSTLE